MTTPYSEQHVSLLLAMMLKNKGVAEAASALDPRYILNPGVGGNHGQAAVFKTIKELWLRYKELSDLVAVMADVTARVERLGSNALAIEQIHAEFHNIEFLLPRLSENSAVKVREFVVFILQTCAIDPRAKEIGAEMMVSGATPALVAEIDVLNNRVASITGSNVVTGLLRRPRPKVGGRLRLGVPWLDSLFPDGSGPVRGSCVGIIAPQNGGKTTMGIQLAVSQALQGNRALLVLVEEGITIPLQCKLFAAALDCPWDAIQRHMGADREMLDAVEDVIDEYKLDRTTAHLKLEAIDKYLTVMDIANNESAGLITIETTILNAHASGKGFELVYIDWAGLIADRMLAGVEVPRAYTSKEDALKQVGVFFAKTAASANNVITISQQMAVIYAAQPYRMFDTYCAADCKMFTQSLKYAFAIGKSDKDGLSVLTLIKARDDKKGIPTIVRLNGAHARFEDCRDTHFFQPANTGVKGRIKRKESNEARVPQEQR